MPERHRRETAEVFPETPPPGDTRLMLKSRSRTIPARASLRAPAAKRSECLAARTLLAIARQRRGLDGARCQLVFEHFDTAFALQTTLHRMLADENLSELQFGVLVALFALDPEPAIAADLASYTAVSRAAITDVLVRLESLQLIQRTRDLADRRVYRLRLTDAGRAAVERALVRYLETVGALARDIEPAAQTDLLRAYRQLQDAAVQLST